MFRITVMKKLYRSMDIELLETLFKQIMEENKKERVNEYDSEIEIETVYKD